MPGNLAEKRRHAASLIAADLADNGRTHKQIAAQLGIAHERVKSYVTLGQRLRHAMPRSPQKEEG